MAQAYGKRSLRQIVTRFLDKPWGKKGWIVIKETTSLKGKDKNEEEQ